MTLTDDSKALADALYAMAVHDSLSKPMLAIEIEKLVDKYIKKTVSQFLGPNASDGAHFQAMSIVDNIKLGR